MRPLRHTDVSTSLPHLPQAAGHAHNAASFPVKRTLSNWFQKAPQLAVHDHDHGHSHGGGKVPLDLDEAAYGAKCAASNFGPWVQRGILGGGIWYAFDGSSHALQDLRAWPQAHARVTSTSQRLAEPLAFNLTASDAQQTHARSNQTALQRIASAHNFNSYAGCVLAAASFVGCLFMGLGLAFDDQMLGYLLPSLVDYTGSCMNVAVPMMVIYALGVAATAGWDFVSNWGRATHLGSMGVPADQFDADNAAFGAMQNRAYGVAQRSISQRQKLSGMATVAGIAMGVGIGLTCYVSTWGLALMLPGALSLPGIMAARHKPEVDLDELATGINSGSVESISNDLVHLDAQITAIETLVHRREASFWQQNVRNMPQHAAPIATADALITSRLALTNTHVRQLDRAEADNATFNRNLAALREETASRNQPAPIRQAFLYQQMLNTLVEDGLFETFAFEIAKDETARAALTDADADAASIDVSVDSLTQKLQEARLGAQANDALLEKRTHHMAAAYLRVVGSAGYQALVDQKEATLDLWLAHVD